MKRIIIQLYKTIYISIFTIGCVGQSLQKSKMINDNSVLENHFGKETMDIYNELSKEWMPLQRSIHYH